MNNLEKYLDQVIEQRPVVSEAPVETPPPPPPPETPTINLLASVRKRWYLVVAVTVVWPCRRSGWSSSPNTLFRGR
jgi:hypothetical protein